MYRAITSFTTNEYEVRKKQLLADDFTNQEEITEFLRIGYIEEYDGSLEITENGIYDVEDYQTAEVEVQSGNLTNEEYAEANNDVDTILENTQLTPIYPPDWSKLGYSDTPESVIDGFNYAKEIKDNWDNTQTNLANKFVNDLDLVYMPLVDTSNVTNMNSIFSGCSGLSNIPLLDTSNVNNIAVMFGQCSSLKSVPQIDTSNVTNFFATFQNCKKLKDVPVFNLEKATNIWNMFQYCANLSNESLNNILAMCIGATSYTGTKTLAWMGLTSAQATICTGLSNYTAFEAAGWSTGF